MKQRTKLRTREEITALIQDHDKARANGESTKDWSNRMGVNPTAIYGWKRKTEKPESAREIVVKSDSPVQREKQLRIENTRLRLIVVDLMLERQALLEYAGRK